MTKEEVSLLLYLETRVVDHAGRVDLRHMNEGDIEIVTKWNKEGFVKFGRIDSKDKFLQYGTHWCQLSDKAWSEAYLERRAKADRTWATRKWLTTEEKRGKS